MRKSYFIQKMVMIISLLFCSMIAVSAAVPEQVVVAGITGTYSNANGTYTKQTVRSALGNGSWIGNTNYSTSYDRYFWKMNISGVDYYIYLRQYSSSGSYYWNIDTNLEDVADNVLFYSNENAGGGYNVVNGDIIPQSPDLAASWSSSGALGQGSITVTTPVTNSAPTNVSLSSSSINENVAANSTVGVLSSTDPDAGNSFTYSLEAGTGSADNASFTISGSNLLINSSPNFESKSSYSIRVRTTDQGSLYYEKAITININDLNEAAVVTTQAVSGIGTTSATGNGNISDLGSPNPTAYGICWNTSVTPTTANSKVDKGAVSATGAFTANISGLTPNTTYYVRAFATNSSGTVYGGEESFTTLAASSTTYSGTSNWSNGSNWSDGLPGLTTDVIVDGNLTIDNSASVKSITVNGGSTLTINSSQTITANNGIYNNGYITNNGTIVGAVVVPIVFEENGGSVVSDITQDFNTALTLPTTTKNGFDFVGWFTEPGLTNLFTSPTMPLNGVTLYAKWQLATSLVSTTETSFMVYPNPASNFIYVKVGNINTQVAIFDINGTLVISTEVSEENAIDISNLRSGVYTLKVNGVTTKVIKR